jgi:hypothetical protein
MLSITVGSPRTLSVKVVDADVYALTWSKRKAEDIERLDVYHVIFTDSGC